MLHGPSAIRVRREPIARTPRCGIRDEAGRVRPRAVMRAGAAPTRRHIASTAWATPVPRPHVLSISSQLYVRRATLHARAAGPAGPSAWGNAVDRGGSVTAARGERQTSRAVRRVLFRRVLAVPPATAIHLGPALPPASSGLPADSGGQPSIVRAEPPLLARRRLLLTLLRVGFT